MLNHTGLRAQTCPTFPDDTFGPVVDQCERAFDFTLLFEESILALLPSAIFLLLAPIRILQLSWRKRKVGGNGFQLLKLVTILAFGILQVALLALWALNSTQKTRTSIAAAVLYLLNSVAITVLSFVEHSKSLKPSILLNLYLVLSILFDAVRTRTLWLMGYSNAMAGLFSASLAMKIIILTLEEFNKRGQIYSTEGECAQEETAGLISRTLFWWLNGLIRKGFTKVLEVNDLMQIDRKLCSEALWASFGTKWAQVPKNNSRALILTVFSTLKWAALAPVIPYLCRIGASLAQPLLIRRFMSYLSLPDDGSQEQRNIGYGLIGAYGLAYIGIAITTAWSQQCVYRFATMVRGCLVTVIYRKTTEMSIVGADDGAAMTLMSTDVERVVSGLVVMHNVWSALLQIGIALFLLEIEVGAAFVVPLLLFLVCGGAVGILSGTAGKRQAGWMQAIEKRVGVTSGMIGAIKGVKMSGLALKMSGIIQDLRLAEIVSSARFRSLIVYIATLSFVPGMISPVITFAVYTIISKKQHTTLDSTRLFTALSLLSLVTDPLDALFQALPEVFAAIACFGRIQSFLTKEPRVDVRLTRGKVSTLTTHISGKSNDASYNTSRELEEYPLQPIQRLSESLGTYDAVIVKDGSFGWKTEDPPVLQDINLKIPMSQLTVLIGPVACGKTTLLKAILGETPVSNGQIQLSSLDIAFCDQTPWMTNQTLQKNVVGFSPFDATWYSSVIHACALVEDIAQFPGGDQSLLGSKGITLSGGQKQRVAIARAVYAKRPIAVFDDIFSGLDLETQKHVFEKVFGSTGLLKAQGTTTILTTHAVHLLPYADKIIALSSEGKLAEQGTFEQLNVDGSYLHSFGLKSGTDENSTTDADVQPPTSGIPASKPPSSGTQDDQTRRLGDRSVYGYYFKAIGGRNLVIFFFLELVWVFLLKFPEIWLKWWGQANSRSPGQQDGMYLGVYTVFQVLSLVCLVAIARHVLLIMAVKSGKIFHWRLLKTVTGASMEFFGKTDAGSIVNRFSQDIQLIDAELPLALLNFVINAFLCIAQTVMILPASYWMIITYPFLFGALWGIQTYYLRTSRQLRFLDLEAKSPLYSQFIETLNGLATIRAFAWQEDSITLNDQRLDFSQKPFYLLYSIQRWLNLVLDLLASILAIILASVAVGLRGSVNVGFAGVALYNIMSLSSTMKAAISHWTTLETSIGAVARVKSFEESTPNEHLAGETGIPPEEWPSNGTIEIENITASYKEASTKVLSNLTLTIKSGEKVGICGRSGSGKSSLILAMLRMIELSEGSIVIDDIDLSTLPRNVVRSRLNTIPQDPYFLSGSIRLNVDPQGTSSDEDIINALEKARLWSIIEEKGGLDTDFAQDLFSHGQRQLFCLARAILNPSKIVIMDEATSSVDVHTDKIMQEIIRFQFKNATIISVAHRLDTILDFDRVLVIDRGVIIEDGNPQRLLSQPSAFKALYDTYCTESGDEE